MMYLSDEQVARVCHEALRAYAMSIGDHTQIPWDGVPRWQKDRTVDGVRSAVANPEQDPAESHDLWVGGMCAAGWKLGKEKRPEVKEHPALVPYEDLSEEQQAKDRLFLAVVGALREHVIREVQPPPVPPADDNDGAAAEPKKKKRPRRKGKNDAKEKEEEA